MLLGPITLGAFVPDDYGAMYCWANDVAAAKFDGAFRPTNLRDVIASCEIGIWIGEEKHRGQGFGKEALGVTLHYCWNHLNLERIGLVVFRHNARAIAAYAACGFRKEGVLRRFLLIDGTWVDLVLMAAFHGWRESAPPTQTASGRAPFIDRRTAPLPPPDAGSAESAAHAPAERTRTAR